ncbi:MAG: potassium transporter Kup [Hyphomicrobiales bacterium]|nr:potassium transporter Kup [Hyphomicrobiales bacterium]
MTHTSLPGVDAGAVATEPTSHDSEKFPVLVLGAIGVVYGDIGTSPIYAFRQALGAVSAQGIGTPEVLGLLSLIVWALTLTVSVKYVFFVTKADNKGEGGTLSLMALARQGFASRPAWLLVLGIVGSALFFGDSIITPAISVLSAVEGVETVAPNLSEFVLPVTILILIGLFVVQRFGTSKMATVFGPIMIVWFLALGLSGLAHIVHTPQVLLAINPAYGVHFLVVHWGIASVVVGAIFLAITGAEALYADLGHFGRRPVVVAWFSLVFPCLLLNYFGQGAFVLDGATGAAANPFFQMHPEWARIPMIVLATCATVIASQACITGTYSLAQQAIALNLLPRMTVTHTSETKSGQIYMPQITTILLIAVLLLVVGFKSSNALSSAYGIAVSGVMLVTAILISIVMWRIWKWHPAAVAATMVPFLVMDMGFFIANVSKIEQGGWVPALVAALVALIMVTWMAGRKRLIDKTRRDEVPLQFLVDNLTKKRPTIVPGTAVFLTSDIEGAPTALLHSLKHYKVLHEHNVILTVLTSNSPRVPDDEKVRIESLSELFARVIVTFGYVETPNIPKALALGRKLGWKFDIMSTSFFLSRRSLKPTPKGGLPFWVDRLFIALARNATDATEYFHIPTGRVVEIGTQVLL